ncbi:MAG: glycosyltransferase family 4 protein [Candidatus Desulfaltia sp.]|nr:glycosyltransferase family 4 protein [Candidatus Desulfaltia sp.]
MNERLTDIVEKTKLKILTSVGYYLPGYKAGGPIRTLANMVDKLGDEFQFKIITADRDFGDTKSYPGFRIDGWNKVGKADVFYMSPKMRSLKEFKKVIYSTECDVIYLNSFFSPHFTIKPLLLRRLRLIPAKPLILAPRGEFSPGALGLKSLKKRVYLWVAKAFGLYRGIIWQASSEHEEADIRRWFGRGATVAVSPDLPPVIHSADKLPPRSEKAAGCLNIVFLSRISRKKNLDGALKMLKGLKGEIQFNIYGPMEDKNYWVECQKTISSVSQNIVVRYCGSVAHDKVGAVMGEHELFFLPTLGENFGHVILEAFLAGCPVLLSDQTPWRDLEVKGVGWDLPLDVPGIFHDVLQYCVGMTQTEYANFSKCASEYGKQVAQDDNVVEQNRRLFYHTVDVMSSSDREQMNV